MLILGGVLLGAALARGEATSRGGNVRNGGTLRVAWLASWLSSVDPAVSSPGGSLLLDAACLRLVHYPDKNPPGGLRLAPEAASRVTISSDGKRYTFTIGRGLRLSNGAPLTVRSFARAFVRALAPSMSTDAPFEFEAVVGIGRVQEGRLPAGIVTRGNRLIIRLTKPVPDLLGKMTLPYLCAVPPNLPIDPEGVGAPIPSGGPYYVAEYVPGRRVVLKRNRFYRGKRPHHVDRIVADFDSASSENVLERIKRGTADWGVEDERGYFHGGTGLRRYRSQFFVSPGLSLFGFYLNSKHGLFKNNVRLRRAANFAVDRRALVRQWGGSLAARATDHYLPPSIPGYNRARIYPARPNVRKAKALARGHLRGRKATLYVRDDPRHVATAQIVKRNLAAIGLAVEVKVWPRGVYYQKLYAPREPWDIGQYGWEPSYIDPYAYLNPLFTSSSGNPAFASRTYDRLLAKAARLRGTNRYRAYGTLDVGLARDAAPMIAAFYSVVPTFVSKRVDPRCVVRRPYLDLAAVCLR
jgi:peptide/nickel transport system substrate-binding protein